MFRQKKEHNFVTIANPSDNSMKFQIYLKLDKEKTQELSVKRSDEKDRLIKNEIYLKIISTRREIYETLDNYFDFEFRMSENLSVISIISNCNFVHL